jgi:hypothetical protein
VTMTRVNLISGPRNISTGLMYAFRSRSDTTVVDEPLYAHYLAVHPEVDHPGREETLASMSSDAATVVRDVLLAEYPTPVVFFKNMGHHVGRVGMDLSWLDAMTNVFLIRDPEQMLTSYMKNITDPTPEMTGMPQQVELLDRILAGGTAPVVLESAQVLLDPPGVLEELCDRIGIPWDPAMLSWEAGPKPEDGVWAEYWYHRLHQTTGFEPYNPKYERLPERIRPTLDVLIDCYDRLRPYAIEAKL